MDATPWGDCFNEMGWGFLMQLDPEYKPKLYAYKRRRREEVF